MPELTDRRIQDALYKFTRQVVPGIYAKANTIEEREQLIRAAMIKRLTFMFQNPEHAITGHHTTVTITSTPEHGYECLIVATWVRDGKTKGFRTRIKKQA